MNTVFIYALKDPVTDAIRYVGKTVEPVKRLRGHLSDVVLCHRTNWIKSLLPLKPVLEIVDEVPELYWPMLEVAYIEFFREQGCDLVNSTAGGEGGHNPSAETRAKISAAHKGKKLSVDAIAKRTAARLGVPLSPSHREAIRQGNAGKIRTPEQRAKMSAVKMGAPAWNKGAKGLQVAWNKGIPMSEERRELHALSRPRGENHFGFGKKHSAEHCAKISAAQSGSNGNNFGKKASEETRAKMRGAQLKRWALKKGNSYAGRA